MQFIDLKSQQKLIREKIDIAITQVLNHGQYIMGPEIKTLEERLAQFTNTEHCVSCSSGTDALLMAMLAIGIKANDIVFVPSFTFPATAEVIALIGATPFFVDACPTNFTISPISLETAIKEAKQLGLNDRAVIAVDMFGQPAEYNDLMNLCNKYNLQLIADAAQSFGAIYHNKPVGSLAHITTTSFFPAKPLGCYGDGGAIFTNDGELAKKLVSIRNHGQGNNKYDIQRLGINGRLDTIQAAILLEKLNIFPAEVLQRNKVAKSYNEKLKDVICTPKIQDGNVSVWAQYTLQSEFRDVIIQELKDNSIPACIYYPKPMHEQAPYRHFPRVSSGLENTKKLCDLVFSLPMHPYLCEQDQIFITENLINALESIKLETA